jgi:ABC-2 type transport system permease protein
MMDKRLKAIFCHSNLLFNIKLEGRVLMFKRVRYIFVKEMIQVLRDKRMRVVLIIPPIFQLIVFGYAANLDVKNIRTAVRDLDQTVESRDVIDRFRSSKYFKVVAYPQTPEEIERLITKGDVILSIEIPSGFSRKVKKGDTGTLQILVDGTESNSAMIALGNGTFDYSTQSHRKHFEEPSGLESDRQCQRRAAFITGSHCLYRASFIS